MNKEQLNEIKKSMESGVSIPKHLKDNNSKFEKADIKNIVDEMREEYGKTEFSRLRKIVQGKNKANGNPTKALHRRYSRVIGKMNSIESVEDCISDLQELLVLCEVIKSELGK